MPLSLDKGSRLPLSKSNGSSLMNVRFELSWTSPPAPQKYDFDISTLLVDSRQVTPATPLGKGIGEEHVCYFHKDARNTPFMQHTKGDSKDGDGEDPDEIIQIQLANIPLTCDNIPAVITIFEAAKKGQSFDQVSQARCDVFDNDTGEHLLTINLAKLTPGSTGALFVSLQRDPSDANKWTIENISTGYNKELGDFFALYGYV